MWPNPEETEDLVTFTEEIFNGKLHFFWAVDRIRDCALHTGKYESEETHILTYILPSEFFVMMTS